MKAKELIQVQETAEEIVRRLERKKGILQGLRESLERDFGFQTLREAQDLLTDIEKELQALQNDIEPTVKKLRVEYEEFIEGNKKDS